MNDHLTDEECEWVKAPITAFGTVARLAERLSGARRLRNEALALIEEARRERATALSDRRELLARCERAEREHALVSADRDDAVMRLEQDEARESWRIEREAAREILSIGEQHKRNLDAALAKVAELQVLVREALNENSAMEGVTVGGDDWLAWKDRAEKALGAIEK